MSNKNNKPDNIMKLKEPNKSTDKNAYTTSKNKDYKKIEIIKDDGRYLIYYDFNDK